MEDLDFYDKLFYYMKEDNSAFSNIIILKIEVEGIIRSNDFQDKLKELLVKYPKLSMIVDNMKWKKVDVKINDHITEIKKETYTNESIEGEINKIINMPFQDKTPKWIFYNLIYNDRSIIIWKIHHSYGDGDKCTEILKSIADHENKEIINQKNNANDSYFMNICKSIYYLLVSFCTILYFILFFKKEKVFQEPQPSSEAIFCNIYNFNVDELKLKKKEMGITMNDLLYGLILKSIRKYANKDINLSSSSMINLRRQNDIESTNNFAFAMFSTKVDESNIFTKVHNQMNNYKKSPIIYFISKVLKYIANFSCEFVVKFLTFIFEKNHFGYSCYNTKIKSIELSGKKIKRVGNIVIPYKQDVFFSLLTFGNEIELNMCYRKGILNEKRFKQCVMEVFSEL